MKKTGDPSDFGEIALCTRHNPSNGKIAKLPQAGAVRVPHNDVVDYLTFEELPGAYQVTRDFDIGFAWGRVSAWVVVNQYYRGGGGDNGQAENALRVN